MRKDIENLKKGDRIYLKPEWMDEGDEGVIFEASEDHNGGPGIYIAERNSKMFIRPTGLKLNSMIIGYDRQ